MPKDLRYWPVSSGIHFSNIAGNSRRGRLGLSQQHAARIPVFDDLDHENKSTHPPRQLLRRFRTSRKVGHNPSRKTVTITEQLLPRSRTAIFDEGVSAVRKETCLEHINARLLLLSSFPSDCPPLAKSVAFLNSEFGSIRAEIHRLPGAENHFFRFFIRAFQSDVTVHLPPYFRGVIHIDDSWHVTDLGAANTDIKCNKAFRERFESGFIRFDGLAGAADYEDELYIQAYGKVDLRIVDIKNTKRQSKSTERIRRIFRSGH